jgi:hypothetical protein
MPVIFSNRLSPRSLGSGPRTFSVASAGLAMSGSVVQFMGSRTIAMPTATLTASGRAPMAGPLPVVPGAWGAGMATRAAYGDVSSPSILTVTNLNDSGSGSLRAALTASGPRVVIFETSGTIVLDSDITISNPYVTVAGQTAPSPGITIRGATNATVSAGGITITTHDVLIQHVRIRPGDGGPVLVSTAGHNALLVYLDGAHDVVIDHCSLSWASGKLVQVYLNGAPGNVTVWRSMLSEALYRAINVDATGTISSIAAHWGLSPDGRADIVQSVFAHSSDRHPEVELGNIVQFINNVVYDWGRDEAIYPWATFVYSSGTDTDDWFMNVVGNVYIGGTGGSHPSLPLYAVGTWAGGAGSRLYMADNAIAAASEYSNNMGFDPRIGSPAVPLLGTPLAASSTETFVLANAGARPADRDGVDSRIVSEVAGRTGTMISSQDDVGGWPTLAQNTRTLSPPGSPHVVQPSGYTALEEWLHGYAAEVEAGGVDLVRVMPTGSLVVAGQTIAQEATDNFNRGSLGGTWTQLYGTVTITSNQLTFVDNGSNAAIYNAFTPGANWEAELDYVSAGIGGPIGNAVTASGGSFYLGEVSASACNIWRIVDGGATQIANGSGVSPGSRIKLQRIGNTIKLFYGGTERLSVTDSTLSGGQCGVNNHNPSGIYDNFRVATI